MMGSDDAPLTAWADRPGLACVLVSDTRLVAAEVR